MSIGMSILTVMISFIGMECMAWFSHKYIMHGFLWKLHKDHHQKTNHWWELNDIFVIIFAIPSFVALLFGFMPKLMGKSQAQRARRDRLALRLLEAKDVGCRFRDKIRQALTEG